MQNLNTENYKTLLTEVKDDPKTKREIPWIEDLRLLYQSFPNWFTDFTWNDNQSQQEFFFKELTCWLQNVYGNANDRKSYSTDKKKPHVAMKMKEEHYLISIWLNPKIDSKYTKKRWYDLNEAFISNFKTCNSYMYLTSDSPNT